MKMDAERLDIEKTLEYLTTEEKLRTLSGDGMWHTFGAGELPRVRMSDGPNGLRMTDGGFSAAPATCYPTAGMLANSWDPALVYSVGVGLGKEATALGVNLLLAPGINIKRHPLGGRNFEYFSEDPVLAGELAKAYVSGVQATGVGACVKHFAANNQEKYRMYSDSVVDERALREIYLKPFRTALEAKPEAVMCAYNKLNGEYCSQNKRLLNDILREEWGYEGVVVSDWGAVRDRSKALLAGLDLAMPDSRGLFEENLADALDRDDINEAVVDRSLTRLLRMTDNIYLEPYGDFDADSHDRLSYSAAAASVVLLRNEKNFLPLTRGMKVAVLGELAESAPIQGGGSSHVSALKEVSPLEAFGARGIDVAYLRGYSSDKKQNSKALAEALAAAPAYDALIVYVGQPAPTEGADRHSLDLPAEQNKLISELTAAGHRVVVVLCSAGPVKMPWVNRVRGIVYAGLNGQNGALAAADVLYGRINPCGRLAETFPHDLSDIGSDFGGRLVLYRESIFVGYRYYDAIKKRVLFPFGHGLSFSNISYDGMTVKKTSGATFDVTVTLTNRSVRDAYETVQIYASDKTGRVLCAPKTLAAFAKIFVEGQTTVTETIRVPASAFAFYNEKTCAFAVPDGRFELMAAASAGDIRLTETVKVDGDFHDVFPFPDNYEKPLRSGIEDPDFEVLLGRELPKPPTPPVKGEFTLDCCLDDIKKTFIGRIMKLVVKRRAKGLAGNQREAFLESAMFTPLTSVSAMSGDALPLPRAKAVIEMANGHFLRGLKALIRK